MRSETHAVHVFRLGASPEQQDVQVPVEQPLHLRINGQPAAIIMRQPGDDVELAVGYCLTDGIVAHPKDVLTVRQCETDADTVDVLIEGEPPERSRFVGTGCMDGTAPSNADLPKPLQAVASLAWSPECLLAMPQQFREQQEQHRISGGVHAAALFDCNGRLVVLREDVGRYSAADKAIGYCALRKQSVADMVLMVSGRAGSLMVLKAARAGVPVLATMSNATSLGVRLAERLGLTLVTYLRGRDFRVCTHVSRIRAEP